ncbi:MAG: GMC family oxidoreductase [Bacteroidia bacterium]|nr:GMC family oxidoreductase [Bacteroidia bacterium]
MAFYFQSESGKAANTYDAIVVGSGISGGWAAKELCEKGLKTIMLERGRNVKHIEDYPTMMMDPWDAPNRGRVGEEELKDYQVQKRTGYTISEYSKHFFVKDTEHPYTEVKRFDWMRGYHVGGRSLLWGRHCYRMSDLDFEANAREGIAADWPIRYNELAPWYDYVEDFVGIQGMKEGLAHLPDGPYLPSIPLNCVESHARDKIKEKLGYTLTAGRTANLTIPHKGRGKCQNRNRCIRGCPYGAYFSTQSSTLPAAEATGNLTLRPYSIVHSVIYDDDAGKAVGVRVIDAETKESMEFYAKVIFLNASCLPTTSIMMNSTSKRFPNGLGNDSGELGHNLMDHHFKAGAVGTFNGFNDKYYKGRRPAGFYIARFKNLDARSRSSEYLRGYGYQGSASRTNWTRYIAEARIGAEMKHVLMEPGPWRMGMMGFGEMLPYHENHIQLDYENVDKWGLPTLVIDCEFKENELAMREDMKQSGVDMLEAAGFTDIFKYDDIGGPGLGIHEMGTSRMGRTRKTSVLNGNNQVHGCPNVYVTDGACMTSAGNQNPSITYMALTARACDHAVKELNKLNM